MVTEEKSVLGINTLVENPVDFLHGILGFTYAGFRLGAFSENEDEHANMSDLRVCN